MRIQLMAAAYAGRVNLIANSPGPIVPLTGTLMDGFFGEVTQEELVGHSELFSLTDTELSGTYIADSTTTWLKFTVEGKVLYISKVPVRSNITWNILNDKGLVNGSFETFFTGNKFKVRLPTGTLDGTAAVAGGEWNETIMKVLAAPYGSGEYGNYPLTDLGFSTYPTTYTICAEAWPANPSYCVVRGGGSGGVITSSGKSQVSTSYGWRPVLEWVSPNEFTYEPTAVGFTAPYVGDTIGFFGSISDQFYLPKEVSYETENQIPVLGMAGSISDQFYLNKDITYSADPLIPVFDIGYAFQ